MQRECAVLSHLWPLSLHHSFQHYLIKSAIFGKKTRNIKRVLFSLQLLSKTFLILEIIQRDIVIYVKRWSARGSHITQVVDGKDGRNQQRHKTDPCVIVYYALRNDHDMGITFSLIGQLPQKRQTATSLLKEHGCIQTP
jgi:hypothetical protein